MRHDALPSVFFRITLLVQRLEERGLVTRERQAADGRVVMVSLTNAGDAAIEEFIARASHVLSASIAEMPDIDVGALADATDTLGQLIAHLQTGPISDAASGVISPTREAA